MSRFLPFLFLMLAACNPPDVQKPSAIGFAQYQPIRMDVGSIDVVEEYKSPPASAESGFPTTPAEAMKAWVADRLRATGSQGRLQVIIKDASVKETKLPRTEGVKGVFTHDQEARYDARLEVELRVYREGAISKAAITVSATRSDTLAENASASVRDGLYNSMVKRLMDEANAELEKNIYAYFGAYISYAP